MHMAKALHRFGTPADQLELALARMSRRLGLHGQFLVTPTSVIVSFGDGGDGHFYLVRHDQGDADLSKLSRLERLAGEVARGESALAEAYGQVDAILLAPPVYGPFWEIAGYAACSAAVARLFRGSVADMVVAGGIGLLLGILQVGARRMPRLSAWLELTMAICSAVFAAGCASLLDGALDQTTATLAGLIVLLPGLTFTTALTELATGNLVSGTARLAGAMVRFMKLGFGVAVGARIGTALFHPPLQVAVSLSPVSEWVALLVAATALAVILQVERREVGFVLLASALGLLGLRFGEHALSEKLAPFLAAFSAVLFSNGYARWLGRTASVLEVPAMLLLVPGSVGYRSVAALMHNDVLQGMQTAFAMGLNATALVAGALLAGLLLPPHAEPEGE